MNDIHVLSPRRERSRQRRRERILRAAMELVANEGFGALTIARLAADLDVAAGGLYRYFASKEVLIASMSGDAAERMAGQLERACDAWESRLPACSSTAALCRLSASARWYIALPLRHPTLFSLVSQVMSNTHTMISDEASVPVAEPFRRLLGQLEQQFEQAVTVAALPPEDALVRALTMWSALHGSLLVGKFARMSPRGNEPFALERRIGLLMSGLLLGWGADAERLGVAQRWAEQLPNEVLNGVSLAMESD